MNYWLIKPTNVSDLGLQKKKKTNAVYFYSPKIEISKELMYYDNAISGDYRLEKKIVIETLFYCATRQQTCIHWNIQFCLGSFRSLVLIVIFSNIQSYPNRLNEETLYNSN